MLAVVFTCDSNKTQFVGYLMKREEVPVKFTGAPAGATATTNFIKKPGDAQWTPETDYGKWMQIERSVKCAQGGEPIMLMPNREMAVEGKRPKGAAPAAK